MDSLAREAQLNAFRNTAHHIARAEDSDQKADNFIRLLCKVKRKYSYTEEELSPILAIVQGQSEDMKQVIQKEQEEYDLLWASQHSGKVKVRQVVGRLLGRNKRR